MTADAEECRAAAHARTRRAFHHSIEIPIPPAPYFGVVFIFLTVVAASSRMNGSGSLLAIFRSFAATRGELSLAADASTTLRTPASWCVTYLSGCSASGDPGERARRRASAIRLASTRMKPPTEIPIPLHTKKPQYAAPRA